MNGNSAINLKKAYRYQAYLSRLYAGLSSYCITNAVYITALHKKSVMPQQEDTTVVRNIDNSWTDKENNIDFLITVMKAIINEKCRTNEYIAEAKTRAGIDIDALTMNNKLVHSLIDNLVFVQKNGKAKVVQNAEKGTGYTINTDGNQVPFMYDIDCIYAPTYDETTVRELTTELENACDANSDAIERAEINTELSYEFVPMFNINDDYNTVFRKVKEQM